MNFAQASVGMPAGSFPDEAKSARIRRAPPRFVARRVQPVCGRA
jgi:hypothetical protein